MKKVKKLINDRVDVNLSSSHELHTLNIIRGTSMTNVYYEISSSKIKPFAYIYPLVNIDQNGEHQVSYAKNSKVYIKQITFLNLVGRNEKGDIVSFEPIEEVNTFLMAHHIDDGKEESDQRSKALIHFFSFLIKLQEKWDEEYDEEEFDPLIDLPRPTWDFMALRKDKRITYQYRAALKYSVLKEKDESQKLARTTASAYINAVTKFYSFHIRQGYQFNNPPFNYEIVTVNFEANGQSMKAYMSKQVHTTDLRLNFPKSKRNSGEAGEAGRRDLRPLTHQQWSEVEKILLHTRRVIKNVKGSMKLVHLAEEYSLFFLLGRYTGLRKEETASLHCDQIVKPSLDTTILRLGVGDEYGSLTKSKNGCNKSRRTIVPSSVMQLLYEYTRSIRYQKRLAKFKLLCKTKRDKGEDAFFDSVDGVDEKKRYVFISNSGAPFFLNLNVLNNRWTEVRNTVKEILNQEVQGSIHNLRSTFAVALFRILLQKISIDKALAEVSEVLGHENIDTTLKYLEIAQNGPTGDEIYEDVLDYLGMFEESGGQESKFTNDSEVSND
jgi:integrase|tara:strand:+ start:46329 stop:47981 length:1653 start_codon:yes stop_codon:yes gene_type:complete